MLMKNEFKQLAREYVELTGESVPNNFFNFTCGNYLSDPPPPPPPAETPTNKNGDLFKNADAIYIFNDIIQKEEDKK